MKPISTDTYNFEGLITRGYTYVDKTEVLCPLINKKYYEKFLNSGKKIMLVGVNFYSEKRTIAEWIVEAL
jgi:hypothetical protein